MNFDPLLFLEIRRGAAIVPESIGLFVLGLYLVREYRRRHLSPLDWARLPPSMSLVLAFFLFDLGVLIETATVWYWRFMGAGDLNDIEIVLLVSVGVLVVVASLCKVRALTYPDSGNRPWLLAFALTALAIFALLWIK